MKRASILAALGACALFFTYFSHAHAATSCSALQQERNNAFAMHAGNVRQLGLLRASLSQMNTDDPVVINKQFNSMNASIKNYRDKFARSTPSEEKFLQPLMNILEDALEFWRSKKANLETGGVVAVSGGDVYRKHLQNRLAWVQETERSRGDDITKLDKQLSACRASQGTGEARTLSRWNGTYVSGPYTIVVSGGFGSLTYTSDRPNGGDNTTDHTKGTCSVHGSEATCEDTGTYSDSDKSVTRTSKITLTFSGNTISLKGVVTTAKITRADGQPCPDIAQCTGIHPGATFEGTWTRKNP